MKEHISKILRRLPVELSVLVTANIWLSAFLLLFVLSPLADAVSVSNVKLVTAQFGLAVGGLVLLIVISLLPWFANLLAGTQDNVFAVRLWSKGMKVLFSLSIFSLFLFLYTTIVAFVFFAANTEYTGVMTLWHSKLDNFLHVYLMLEVLISQITNLPFLYDFLYVGYTYLATGVILCMGIFAYRSLAVLRMYVMTIFIAMLISAPIWLVFPTVGPLQVVGGESELSAYTDHQLLYGELESLSAVYEKSKDTDWAEDSMGWADTWNQYSEKERGHAISNNPSTHVIWYVAIVYFSFMVSRVFGFVALFGLFGGFAGTIIFAQHYVIDIFAGTGVAFVAIWAARKLLDFESKYCEVNKSLWFASAVPLQRIGEIIFTKTEKVLEVVFTNRKG